ETQRPQSGSATETQRHREDRPTEKRRKSLCVSVTLWRILFVCSVSLWQACASAPPAPPKPLGPTPEQKMAWILRLEDERVLRDPTPVVTPPPLPARGRKTAPAAAPPPPPDLVPLLADPEARIRRRAALAIGRVGLREGVAPLVKTLADRDPEV